MGNRLELIWPRFSSKQLFFKPNPNLNFVFRIQRPEMEVARAKVYPAECLRMFYLKYFRAPNGVHTYISHFTAFRISVQLSIFPRDVMIVWRHNCVAAWVDGEKHVTWHVHSEPIVPFTFTLVVRWRHQWLIIDDVIIDDVISGLSSTLLSRIYI